MTDLYVELTRPLTTKEDPEHGHPLPLISKAIRYVEGTEYSHIRIHWVTNRGVKIIYEAASGKVDFVGKIAQKERPVKIVKSYKIHINDDAGEKAKLVDVCLTYAGVDYGQLQLVGILLVRLFGLEKNPLSQGRNSQVCSEIVARILTEVKGWEIDMDLDIAGPKDVDEMLYKLSEQGLCELVTDDKVS